MHTSTFVAWVLYNWVNKWGQSHWQVSKRKIIKTFRVWPRSPSLSSVHDSIHLLDWLLILCLQPTSPGDVSGFLLTSLPVLSLDQLSSCHGLTTSHLGAAPIDISVLFISDVSHELQAWKHHSLASETQGLHTWAPSASSSSLFLLYLSLLFMSIPMASTPAELLTSDIWVSPVELLLPESHLFLLLL